MVKIRLKYLLHRYHLDKVKLLMLWLVVKSFHYCALGQCNKPRMLI